MSEDTPRFTIRKITDAPNTSGLIEPALPSSERSEQIKKVLGESVGDLTIRAKMLGDTSGRVFVSKGTGFLVSHDGIPYVVTAQHVVNLNFGNIKEDNRLQRISSEISFGSAYSSIIELGDACYFPNEEDLAVVRLTRTDGFEGKPLKLLGSTKDASDDGRIYFAGYPGYGEGELTLLSAPDNGMPFMVNGEQVGFSGGPLFVIKDDEINVVTVLTAGRQMLGVKNAPTQFVGIHPTTFSKTLNELLETVAHA